MASATRDAAEPGCQRIRIEPRRIELSKTATTSSTMSCCGRTGSSFRRSGCIERVAEEDNINRD